LANPGKFLYPAPLTTLSAAALRQKLSASPAGGRRAQLYVHLPFCETICTFCPIHKYQLGPSSPVNDYIDALKTELRALSRLPLIEQLSFESIYFGGGTPSVTSDRHLHEIAEVIRSSFRVAAPQATFEGHVRTLTRDKIRVVRSLGFNRLSTGIQTFDTDLRRALNLTPTRNEIRGCLDAARDEGVEDFNIDLMFNLPGQTSAVWLRDLQEAVSLEPSGIDVYETVIAHPTALHAQVNRGELRRERDPWQLTENYLLAEQILGDSGYRQKNLFVWNREGFENKLVDCQADLRDNALHIIGAGLTAYSLIDGESFINEAGLGTYIDRVRENGHGIKWHHKCTPREERERFMILSLEEFRFDRRRFAARFGEEMDHEFAAQFRSFTRRGLIRPDASGYRLTHLGRAWAATMAIEFYGEPALRNILGARVRRSYFGGMTSEEEFELPLFAAYHPRQMLRGWRDFRIVVEYVRYLVRQNRRWPREMATLLAAAAKRYGLPAVGWWSAAFLKCVGPSARRVAGRWTQLVRCRLMPRNRSTAPADARAEHVQQ
jgi:oxygen-independent coproporphyrinogen-3 oxidase